jgi:thioredoxin 1
MVITLTRENVQQTIENHKVVVIDFWATWCGPCKMFGPIFERVAQAFAQVPQVAFCKAEIGQQQAMANHFGVKSVPTIVIIKDKQVVHNQAGGPDAQSLSGMVNQALAS